MTVPVGGIILWSGNVATIPAGWALCDGGNATPDLRDRFVIGAGTVQFPAHASGGAWTAHAETAGGHSHGGATAAHALTAAELPASPLTLPVSVGFWSVQVGGSNQSITQPDADGAETVISSDLGSGVGHTHTLAVDPGHQHDVVDVVPPYYALAYIMRVS